MSTYATPRNGNTTNSLFNSYDYTFTNGSFLPSSGSSAIENAILTTFNGQIDTTQQLIFNNSTATNRYIQNCNKIIFCDNSGLTNSLIIKATTTGICAYDQSATNSGQHIFTALDAGATKTTILSMNTVSSSINATSTITLTSPTIAFPTATTISGSSALVNILTNCTGTVSILPNTTSIYIGSGGGSFNVNNSVVNFQNLTSLQSAQASFGLFNSSTGNITLANTSTSLALGNGSGSLTFVSNTVLTGNGSGAFNMNNQSSGNVNLFNNGNTTVLSLGGNSTTVTLNNLTINGGLNSNCSEAIFTGTNITNVLTQTNYAHGQGIFRMPFQGVSYKRVFIHWQGLQATTTNTMTLVYTFPTAFTSQNRDIGGSDLLAFMTYNSISFANAPVITATNITITITANVSNTNKSFGVIVIEGQ